MNRTAMYFVAGFYTFVTLFGYILTEGFDFYWLHSYYFGEGEALGIVLIVLWAFAIFFHLYNAHLERKNDQDY